MQGTQFACREIFACGIKNHGLWIEDCLRFPCVGRRKTLDRHVVPLAVKTVREESVNSNTDILFPLKKLNKNMEYLKIIECRLSLFFVTCRSDLSAGSVYIHSYTHNTTRDLPHSLVPLQLPWRHVEAFFFKKLFFWLALIPQLNLNLTSYCWSNWEDCSSLIQPTSIGSTTFEWWTNNTNG